MNAQVEVHDPWVDRAECEREYGLVPVETPTRGSYDAVLIAVAHRQFRDLGSAGIRALTRAGGIVFDAKYVLPGEGAEERL
jgi:UDP-N-acetyl-D-galactosamine dehydrogenase